ncbi:MAG: DUF3568 family protein [Phycisphaeraceae bacterium]
MQRLTAATLLTLIALTSAGCLAVAAAGAAGAGVAYVRGASQGLVKADPATVIEAGEAVVDGMDMTVISSEADQATGELRGRTATDKAVNISATREGDGVSKVRVRVGTFGDRQLSDELYRRIANRLEE